MKKLLKNKIIVLAAVNLVLVALIITCIIGCGNISKTLLTQQAAETWKGQSEDRFSQVSVFFPVDAQGDKNSIQSFRSQIDKKIAEAITSVEDNKGSQKPSSNTSPEGEDVENERQLWTDAYYTTGAVSAEGDRGAFQAQAVGVEGDFFLFHPYELLSGSYIYDTDIMKDRVVLDYDLAWKLFGSASLEGMTVKINNHPYYIAGVVRRETDEYSQKCFTGEPMVFMFHSALEQETGGEEGLGVSGYEIVMADPITSFVKNFVTESLGTGALVVENTTRYDFSSIFSIFKNFGTRSLKTDAVVCPYWENAARMSEVYIARLWVVAAILSVVPFISLVWLSVLIIRLLARKLKQGKKAAYEAWDDRYGRMETFRNRRAERKNRQKSAEGETPKRKKWGKKAPAEEEKGEESLETFWTQKEENKQKPAKTKKPSKRAEKSKEPQPTSDDEAVSLVREYFDEKEVSEDVERIVREFMEDNDSRF